MTGGHAGRQAKNAQAQARNPLELTVGDIMSRNPVEVALDTFAIEAARILEDRKITFLVVKDGAVPAGILHIHDLLGAKVI